MDAVLTHFENFKKLIQNDFQDSVFNVHDLVEHASRKFQTRKSVVTNKASLRVAFLNVNGKLYEKLEIGHPVRKYVDTNQPDIIVFLETMVLKSTKIPELFSYKRYFKSGFKTSQGRGRPSGGMCTFVKTDLTDFVTIKRSRKHHVMCVGIREPLMKRRSWFIFVYARPEQESSYYSVLFEAIQKISKDNV